MSDPEKKRAAANAASATEPPKVPAYIHAKAAEGEDEGQAKFRFWQDLAGTKPEEQPVANAHFEKIQDGKCAGWMRYGGILFRGLVRGTFFPLICLLQVVRDYTPQLSKLFWWALKVGGCVVAVFGLINGRVIIRKLVFRPKLRFEASNVVVVFELLLCAFAIWCLSKVVMKWLDTRAAGDKKVCKPKTPAKPTFTRAESPRARRNRR
jgi:hypothetical protein